MGLPCSLHFLSNKSTNSVACLDFSIDLTTLFFDNYLCSISTEYKALNIYFNDFDESFSVDSLFFLKIRSSQIRFSLKNLFEWLADSDVRLPNFAKYCLAHRVFVGSFDSCFGSSSWRTVARTVSSWFDQYSQVHYSSNLLAADWHRFVKSSLWFLVFHFNMGPFTVEWFQIITDKVAIL